MSAGDELAVAPGPAAAPPRPGPPLVVAAGVLAATAGLVVLTGASPFAFVLPTAIAAAGLVLWLLPLRWSASALLLALLTLDVSEDASGKWHTPLVFLGDLLQYSLDRNFAGRLPALGGLQNLSGMEILIVLLLIIGAWRRAHGDTTDSRRQVQTAGAITDGAVLFLAGVALATANGLAGGGKVGWVIVQVRPLLHVPAAFFLFHAAYRGPEDHRLLARLVVLAACWKAILAIHITRMFEPGYTARGIKWMFSTNHGDSILFAIAMVVLIAGFIERPDRRRLAALATFGVLILAGMKANNRRLAWVDLAAALAAIYAVTPWPRWKRQITQVVLVAVPVGLLYVAAGWNSAEGKLFGPVRTLRTLADAKVDRSTMYRNIENWNLAMSISEAPVLGRGFGHGFTEYLKGDDISSIFELYLLEPHNAVLGLMLFGGLVGFTAMWSLLSVVIYLAVRAYGCARSPEDRAAALVGLAAMVVVAVQTYGDLGQYSVQWQLFVPLAMASVGKLAIATGAWPQRIRSRARLERAVAAAHGDAGARP